MADKEHLRKLLSDAIPVLCRNGLPPSVTFRVEALIGITIVDDTGGDAVGGGNVTLLSFQQTVSDNGVVSSQFGSNAGGADDIRTTSQTPCKRSKPAITSVKQEYSVETSVKQEYAAETYPSHAIAHAPETNSYEDYGTGDGAECLGDEGDYVGEEEYYEGDGEYYDDGSGCAPGLKYEASDEAYDDTYMQGEGEYVAEDYAAQPAVGRQPKAKKPRLSAAGTQPGSGRGRKTSGTARGGGTRPRGGGKVSQDHATALAVRQLSARVTLAPDLCLIASFQCLLNNL